MTSHSTRAAFGSRLGLLATMIGVAVGLGNIWRFPYIVGKFGGASFVLIYVIATLVLGVPALMAEWTLGRATRRGPVGAFQRAGLPGGKVIGWLFFFGVAAAAGYYTNALGWVLFYTLGQIALLLGLPWPSGAILPPETGFDGRSFGLQLAFSATVLLSCGFLIRRGLRRGAEFASKILMPVLLASLIVLIIRSLTLPGAWAGVQWYIWKVDLSALQPQSVLAAIGQSFFSLSLGGTFMVVYGSYLADSEPLPGHALWTAAGDLGAGLLAGMAILPAVIALGFEPTGGPGLLFSTLPAVFAQLPLGALFGLIFFCSLLGAAFLSDVGALEVLVAGLTDNTSMDRGRATTWVMVLVGALAIPPMINLSIFVPWDLTFGSGFQTVGALLAAVTVAWSMNRATALKQLGGHLFLYWWLRLVLPAVLLGVGAWWFKTEVLG